MNALYCQYRNLLLSSNTTCETRFTITELVMKETVIIIACEIVLVKSHLSCLCQKPQIHINSCQWMWLSISVLTIFLSVTLLFCAHCCINSTINGIKYM